MRARWPLIILAVFVCYAFHFVLCCGRWDGGRLNAAVIFTDNMGDPDDTDSVSRSGGGGGSLESSQNLQLVKGAGKPGAEARSSVAPVGQSGLPRGCAVTRLDARLTGDHLLVFWFKFYLHTLRR